MSSAADILTAEATTAGPPVETATKDVVRSKRVVLSTATPVTGQTNTPAGKPRTWKQTRSLRKLKEFKLLPKLPVELRLMIWGLLLPEYAIHEVRMKPWLETCCMEQYYLLQRGFPATMGKSLLLRVNRESRSVALQAYTPLLARNSVVAAIGQKLYPWDDLGFPNNYPRGHIVTESMPEVDNHIFRGRYFDPPIPVRGVLIKFPKRSFVDLKHDTLYFNNKTYIEDAHHGKSLKHINQYVRLEDSRQVKHLAIDYQMWSDASPEHEWYPEDLESAKYLDEGGYTRYHSKWMSRPAYVNKLGLQFGYLFQDGAFASLETLTLVFYDSGYRLANRDPRLEVGPITFVDEEDLGPMIRRKGGRQPGPFEAVARAIGMPTLPNPAAVLAQIEVLKADTATQLAELQQQKPDMHIPEIKWRFAHRNGKFKQH